MTEGAFRTPACWRFSRNVLQTGPEAPLSKEVDVSTTRSFSSKIRAYQDIMFNLGWRIQHIPHAARGNPIFYGTQNLAVFLSLLSFIVLAAAGILIIYHKKTFGTELVASARMGLGAIMLLASAFLLQFFTIRITKRNWVVVRAQCLDMEVRDTWNISITDQSLKDLAQSNRGAALLLDDPMIRGMIDLCRRRPKRRKKGPRYQARLLCEFSFRGRMWKCTPTPLPWHMTPRSEESIMTYLNTRISPDGGCSLRINPANPLQAELAAKL